MNGKEERVISIDISSKKNKSFLVLESNEKIH